MHAADLGLIKSKAHHVLNKIRKAPKILIARSDPDDWPYRILKAYKHYGGTAKFVNS